MPQTILITVREEWQSAWQSMAFRRKMITGIIAVIAILSVFPVFFQSIEKRNGFNMPDPLLEHLPAHDVSLAIFIFIWAITLLMVLRAVRAPRIFLIYVWSYFILCLLRVITISLVPLNAPEGLVGLVDPVSNFFYGEKFVTRDLFFSGHTSTVFLMYLCLPGRQDKRLALIATAVVGMLLLVQHVHYTLDIVGALLFAGIARWLALRTVIGEEEGK